MTKPSKPVSWRRSDYPHTFALQTRWSDNDMFGHVNNVEYHRFFEQAVVSFLMKTCGLDLLTSPVIPFAAENLCRFRRSLSWPEQVTVGLMVEHLGKSSLRLGLALFGEGQDEAAAEGYWVQVFVDRASQQPVTIPESLRQALQPYRQPGSEAK